MPYKKKIIYTSYWAIAHKVPNPISISLIHPKSFQGIEYDLLMPSWSILNDYKAGLLSKRKYVKEYIKLLNSRGSPGELISNLPKECTLMCWEKSGRFCHRRVFAIWIKKKLGVEIPEWHEH